LRQKATFTYRISLRTRSGPLGQTQSVAGPAVHGEGILKGSCCIDAATTGSGSLLLESGTGFHVALPEVVTAHLAMAAGTGHLLHPHPLVVLHLGNVSVVLAQVTGEILALSAASVLVAAVITLPRPDVVVLMLAVSKGEESVESWTENLKG
jgi:hypothetical protein